MKNLYLWSFVAVWALAAVFVAPRPAETLVGAAILRGMAALGATLVVWPPVAGTVAAIRWFRKTTI